MSFAKTALVADDDEPLRSTMRRLLEGDGYQVVEARDGEEALTLLGEQTFSIGLIDHRMPGKDGLRVIREACGCGRRTPLVMVTGYGEVELAVQALKAGARDFLRKPFTRLELLQKVEEHGNAGPVECPEQHLILMYVRGHCRQIHTLEDVARPLGLSEKTISRQLTRATGLGFRAFLRQVRLEEACKLLLAREDLRISEVAYAVGFTTPASFSRLFRRALGCTPRAYRLKQKVQARPEEGEKKG